MILSGTPEKPKLHLGIDVSPSKRGDGSANDPRRGSPVYATIKPTIEIKDLNAVQAFDSKRQPMTGLGIPGQGTATLERAVVIPKPWQPNHNATKEYGDVLGLACRYSYTKNDGSPGHFTLNIEYAHLITEDYYPLDGKGNLISKDTWVSTGKGIGFGDQMKKGAILSKEQLSGTTPPLVGYLGATQFPHVHIQAICKVGQDRVRIDPSVMLDNNRSLRVK